MSARAFAPPPERLRAFNLLSPLATAAFAAIASRVGCEAPLEPERWPDLLRRPAPWVAFACGWHYVRARARLDPVPVPLAAPVLADARYEDRPGYFSELVVRRDSPYERLADLRGASCAFNEETSFSGCILPAASLARRGWSRLPFARLVRVGCHRRALDGVAGGRFDAAPVDSWVLDLYRRADPDAAARLRVLERFGPAPPPPVVGYGLAPGAAAMLTRALIDLSAEPDGRARLEAAGITRFVSADDRTYDFVREAIVTARNLPWTPHDGRPPDLDADLCPR